MRTIVSVSSSDVWSVLIPSAVSRKGNSQEAEACQRLHSFPDKGTFEVNANKNQNSKFPSAGSHLNCSITGCDNVLPNISYNI